MDSTYKLFILENCLSAEDLLFIQDNNFLEIQGRRYSDVNIVGGLQDISLCNTSSLIISNNNYKNIDINYFLLQSENRNSCVVNYNDNSTNNLFWIDPSFKFKKLISKNEQYVDGYFISGVFLIQEELVNLDLFDFSIEKVISENFSFIPLPICNNQYTGVNTEPVLFLDRDGIINIDKGYVHKISEIEWIEETSHLMKWWIGLGRKIVILTNQSGIARGMYSIKELNELHQEMNKFLQSNGINIFQWEYCPYHTKGTVDKYAKNSLLRKPNPGMLLKAGENIQIDFQKSFMIGDNITDQLLTGIKSLIIRGRHVRSRAKGELIFDSISDATDYIKHLKYS